MILTGLAVLARLAFDPSLARVVAAIATLTAGVSSAVYLSECLFLDWWWGDFVRALPAVRPHLGRSARNDTLVASSFFALSGVLLFTGGC